jgi:hypothetical protein
MIYFLQTIEHDMNMHANFQYWNMYRLFWIIYVVFYFLEFYIEYTWSNNQKVEFSAQIYLTRFIQNLFWIF